jgi:hypothetical protein
MRCFLSLVFLGLVLSNPNLGFGQSAVDRALDEYDKEKAALIERVVDAFDFDIAAAKEKGDLVKAKTLEAEKEAFLKQETPPGKVGLAEAIEEYERRLKKVSELDSNVQRLKMIEESRAWLKANLSKKPVKLVFTIRDVSQSGSDYYTVYVDECETKFESPVELRAPGAFTLKMSAREAEKIGPDYRVTVTGKLEAESIMALMARVPVFYIDEPFSRTNALDTSDKFTIFMKDPVVKLLKK